MRFLFNLIPAVAIGISGILSAQVREQTVTTENVGTLHPALLEYCRWRVLPARYMQVPPDGEDISVPLPPGWDVAAKDARMREYTYQVEDDVGNETTRKKRGRVVMFNPSAELLATWIANAIAETSDSKERCDSCLAIEFAQYIRNQSGGQFPVVGTVWEDLLKDDGICESYPFVDGITVVSGPKEYGASGAKRNVIRLDEPTLVRGLMLRWNSGQPGRFARISSVTKKMITRLYAKMGKPIPSLNGLDYPAYVRKAYINAMNGPRNELLVAHALFRRETGTWSDDSDD